MDESTLIRRLGALEAPDPGAARRRATARVPARVAALRASRRHRRPLRRVFSARVAVAAALTVLALGLLTAFTPPGRAVASWVGDQLGFGQVGEHPTLRQLRHKLLYAPKPGSPMRTQASGQAAYVLARGPAPHDSHWEYITYRSNRDDAHCFEVEIAKLRQIIGGGCEGKGPQLSATRGLVVDSAGGNTQKGMRLQMVAGRASSDVQAIRAEVDGHRIPVQLTEPPPALLQKLGFSGSFKVYAAFPPFTTGGANLTLRPVVDGVPGRAVVRPTLMILPDLEELAKRLRRGRSGASAR
jgi:hypothetical protein